MRLVDTKAGNLGNDSRYDFQNSYLLQTVILRNEGVLAVGNTGYFKNSPVQGYNGLTATVYVPSTLIESYQTATNWSTWYTAGYVTFVAIEGSPYESLTWWEDDPSLLPE